MKLGLMTGAMAFYLCHSHAFAQPEIRDNRCQPTAQLSGEATIVLDLQDQLTRLGVSPKAAPNCPEIRVSIERVDTGFFVAVSDSSGRSAYRRLSTIRIAATWIDSWLQDDLVGSLLAVKVVARQFRETPSQSILPSVGTSSRREPDSSESYRWVVGVGYETASTPRDAAWRGLRANACARFSIVCIGVAIRASETATAQRSTDDLADFSYNAFDALTELRVPIAFGRSTLIPHLAMGVGRMKTHRSSLSDCPSPTVGSECSIPTEIPTSRISWAPRAEAGISLSLPITSSLHVQLGGTFDIRPLGKRSITEKVVDDPDGPFPCPEPIDPTDPICMGGPDPIPVVTLLPSEVEQFWRFSIGLQVQL